MPNRPMSTRSRSAMRGARMNVAMSTNRATWPLSMGSSYVTRGMMASRVAARVRTVGRTSPASRLPAGAGADRDGAAADGVAAERHQAVLREAHAGRRQPVHPAHATATVIGKLPVILEILVIGEAEQRRVQRPGRYACILGELVAVSPHPRVAHERGEEAVDLSAGVARSSHWRFPSATGFADMS